MLKLLSLRIFPLLLAVAVLSCVHAQSASVDASAAVPKTNNERFFSLHESFLERAKAGPVGLLFLGDSITEGWGKAPDVWSRYYGEDDPANFGIGGDQTQHVIWRIEQGELEGIAPKVVVLMIGTNNTGQHSAAEIFAANKKIVSMIRERLPETKVLLLAIFPRGPRSKAPTPDDHLKRMAIIDAVNEQLATLDDGDHVRFLNINQVFLDDEGRIPNELMPDQLHPNEAGYKLWAEAMDPVLREMLTR